MNTATNKVVDLQAYRTRTLEQRCFGAWRRRFAQAFDLQTRLTDLSDSTLYRLAQPGEWSTAAYYEFIMGVLDLGPAAKFHYLDSRSQMGVVDIHLFLADQVRFEMLCRLNWIRGFEAQNLSIYEMARDFRRVAKRCRQKAPVLALSHPEYESYALLAGGDREVFIRRLFQPALEAFKERL